ncbi:MAG: phosphoribosylglycinamide formyltransferase [Mariprofundales bacterium]|nr:phosphoribosylglycinamide formyltransferase [Mariprofundales bacterium]
MTAVAIAVLASGRGSNLQAILQAAQAGSCPVVVTVVIADRAQAAALEIAQRAGVPVVQYIDPKAYENRAAFDVACGDLITKHACQWVVLAGYMRIVSEGFVHRFSERIINIHPALLPAFPGAHGVEDALHHGVKVSGCTVHLVDDLLDHGPILAQAAVPVLDDDDDANVLRVRIQQQEHQLYPHTLAKMVNQGFDLIGRRVVWRGGKG